MRPSISLRVKPSQSGKSGRRAFPQSSIPSGIVHRLAALIPKSFPVTKYYEDISSKQIAADILHDILENPTVVKALKTDRVDDCLVADPVIAFNEVMQPLSEEFAVQQDAYEHQLEVIAYNGKYGLKFSYMDAIYPQTIRIDLLEKTITSLYGKDALPYLYRIIKLLSTSMFCPYTAYLAGGCCYNELMSEAIEENGIYEFTTDDQPVELTIEDINSLQPDTPAWKKHFEIFNDVGWFNIPHRYYRLRELYQAAIDLQSIYQNADMRAFHSGDETFLIDDIILFVPDDGPVEKLVSIYVNNCIQNGAMFPGLPYEMVMIGKETSIIDTPLGETFTHTLDLLNKLQAWKPKKRKNKTLLEILS